MKRRDMVSSPAKARPNRLGRHDVRTNEKLVAPVKEYFTTLCRVRASDGAMGERSFAGCGVGPTVELTVGLARRCGCGRRDHDGHE